MRQRASSPKLQVFNTALMGAIAASEGFGFARLRATPQLWGRMVESAVGAQLLAKHLTHSSATPVLHYWRDGTREVDFVLKHQGEVFALEVKSGASTPSQPGLDAFCTQFAGARPQVIGTGGVPLDMWFTLA
jgi:uncharacterized protein